jgi:hypothetical protein
MRTDRITRKIQKKMTGLTLTTEDSFAWRQEAVPPPG